MCHNHDHYEPIEDWVLFPHDKTKPCSVLVFNFGNELYEDLENTWYVCGKWNRKLKLIHKDETTYIKKIATWKVVLKPFTKWNV